jgi:hypothetical protein
MKSDSLPEAGQNNNSTERRKICRKRILGIQSRNRIIMTTRNVDRAAKSRPTIVLAGLAVNRFAKTAPGWTARGSNFCQEGHLPMRSNRFAIFDAVVASKLANL